MRRVVKALTRRANRLCMDKVIYGRKDQGDEFSAFMVSQPIGVVSREGGLPDPGQSATVVLTSAEIQPTFKMKTCSHCAQENDDAAIACLECGTEFAAPEIPEDPNRLLDPALSLAVVATFRNVIDAGLFRA